MDLTQLLRALGLQQAYQSYQENIGQPFANVAGPFGRGLLGLERPEYGQEQAYRTGQAVGNMPAVSAPVGAFKAAMQAPELLAAMGAIAPKGARQVAKALTEAGTLKNAPQDEALEIARQNAVKMLGLPETNTAMDRARALGFDVDAPMLHGGRPNIEAFDLEKLGSTTGARSAEEGIFTTNKPEQATFYALAAAERVAFEKWLQNNSRGESWKKIAADLGVPNNLPLQKRIDFLREAAEQARTDPMQSAAAASAALRSGEIPNVVGGETVYPLVTQYLDPLHIDYNAGIKEYNSLAGLLAEAKKQGKQHVVLTDVPEGSHNAVWDIHFNPANIRSRFAAFDPARINEKNLLASLAAMGVALPVTMGLLSEQTD